MEAGWVADRISELREDGLSPADMGVLFRSSAASITLQAELMKRSVPFRVFGGIRFYEASHVKDVLAILRIFRPRADELAWHRSLMLIEGIGAKTADRILNDVSAAAGMEEVLGKALPAYSGGFRFSGGLKDFESFLRRVHRAKSSLSGELDAVIDYYTPVMKKKFDDWHVRLKDLSEIKEIAARYDSAEKFIADFTIDSPGRGESAGGGEDVLTLSTVHSAKGLEWEAVFFIGLIEGILPTGFSMADESLVEEENRLFYVGVTRAKTHLYLTAHFGQAGWRDSGFGARASRFVESRGVVPCLDILNRSRYL
jgi:DNA helicase II / ATP-dependent DNA helicase PcrA